MKKIFYLSMTIVVMLIGGLLIYAIYLNRHSETVIAERMKNMKLSLQCSEAKIRDIRPVLKMSLINLYSDEMTDVVSLIDGRVTREFVKTSDRVDSGTPIIELVNETIPLKLKEADSDIAEAEVLLMRAKHTYSRYEQLVAENAISLERFDEALVQLKAAEARLERFKSQKEQLLIQQSRQIITSSIRGQVLKIYKPSGSYVTTGMPVALVGNFDKLYFKTSLSDGLAQNIATNQMLEIKFPSDEKFSKAYGVKYENGNLGENEIFDAKIVDISPPMTESSSIRQTVFEIDNRSGLLEPGFYNDIFVINKSPHKCLAVPIEAMIDDKLHSLFVVQDGVLRKKYVETGLDDGNYIEILSGLSDGEIVVISETEGLRENTAVEIILSEEDEDDG